MGKHPFGGLVRCPYYKYEGPQMIYCEGVVKDSSLHLAFSSKTQMRDYRKQMCEGCYNKCLIAQMLNRKYDYE